MLNSTVKFITPQENLTDKVPADVYQVILIDVKEAEGTDFNTGEPKKQLKFFAQIAEGDEKDKIISFFTTFSWFNGGKSAKPSKLFNLVKAVWTYYRADVKIGDVPIIEADDVNNLIGKQLRVAVEETEKGWPKVTSFLPVKKEVKYESKADVEELRVGQDEVNIDDIPDNLDSSADSTVGSG